MASLKAPTFSAVLQATQSTVRFVLLGTSAADTTRTSLRLHQPQLLHNLCAALEPDVRGKSAQRCSVQTVLALVTPCSSISLWHDETRLGVKVSGCSHLGPPRRKTLH